MVDNLVVCLYLIAILCIGLIKSNNVKSMKDFAVSDRSYPIFIMIATLSATWIGGGTIIGLTEKVYSNGIIFLFVFLGDFVCKILNAVFIAPKIGKFYGFISTGDIMEQAYGCNAKILTGLCGLLLSLGVISTQITAIGYFLGNFLHISKLSAIIIGFGIIILYATAGGIKSVTITDVIQFITIFIGIPVILLFAIKYTGGIEAFFKKIPNEKLLINQQFENNFQHFIYFLVFSFALSSPVFTQRLLMSKNPQQAVKAMKITALLDLPFYIILALIALAAFTINKNVMPTNALFYVIDNILPIGVKGLAFATILAAIMSTADSFLNTAAVSFVHDIIKPIRNSLQEESSLSLARVATFILGVISVIIGYYADSVYKLLFYSRISWQPLIMVPFLAVIMGYKVHKYSFYIGFFSSLLFIIGWEYFNLNNITKIHSILVGSLINFFFFTISNYILNRSKDDNRNK